jgi:hypothetical protein
MQADREIELLGVYVLLDMAFLEALGTLLQYEGTI